jgi:two-component system phosphate regulon response regulator PhoB
MLGHENKTVDQPRRQRTILVVDDEEAIRALLTLQLEDVGYRVVVAESARRAARLVRDEKPDLMIVDAHMPYVNGLDFVSALIADSSMPWVPVIFMTGRSELRSHAESLGSACLVKPFLASRLIEVVERVLRSLDRLYGAAGVASERPGLNTA